MNVADLENLERERDDALDRIRQLDSELAQGSLTEAEHLVLRDEQVVRAAGLLHRLDAVASTSSPRATVGTSDAVARTKRTVRTVVVSFAILAVLGIGLSATDRLGGGLTGSTPQDVPTLLQNAQQLTAQGNGVDAVKTYDKVIEKDPNNAEALTYRGWLVRLAGLPNEGLKSIDKAIAANPTYPDAHFFKGFILLRDRNDPNAAIPEFRAFLANNPPQDMVSMVQQALADAEALAAAAD